MAFWSGKGLTLSRMNVLKMRCFQAFKQYREFKKHSEAILKRRNQTNRIKNLRNIFQAWHKNFKV